MAKYRFVIIGSGWRAAYYIRIAKALPNIFVLCAVYCRSQDKADKLSHDYGINVTTSEDECSLCNPDFVVVSVSKSAGAEVASRWMDKGFTVLMETPAALDIQTITELWKRNLKGQKLVVAEQYTRYPQYSALLKIIKRGYIGDVSCLNISIAHDYHGASLMRALLGVPVNMPFSVFSKTYSFPTVETLSRYEEFHDGRISDKKRRVAVFEFDNGKTCIYDFDSEQYRSPIRRNTYKVQGVKGEIIDNVCFYLDTDNNAHEKEMIIKYRPVDTDYDNPNLRHIKEVEKITFDDETIYEPPFGLCGLRDDETAMAILMEETALYARNESDTPYPLRDALQDAYMAILMDASETGNEVINSTQILQ